VRNICSQARLLHKINKPSKKKVRQNRLSLSLRAGFSTSSLSFVAFSGAFTAAHQG
jgi:hypothetical protein